MKICTRCGKTIDESNYSMVDNVPFCSDECNVKHHEWDKIPNSKALSTSGK